MCAQMEENLVDEHDIFENGMSLIDLTALYLEQDKFSGRNWWLGSGYCCHSGWYLPSWYSEMVIFFLVLR